VRHDRFSSRCGSVGQWIFPFTFKGSGEICRYDCRRWAAPVKWKITHDIGQELALLSVGELAERITLLKEEIARLEVEMKRKNASKSAADTFFKK
jgi:uncharacterized small protein (DUF1192 family)